MSEDNIFGRKNKSSLKASGLVYIICYSL